MATEKRLIDANAVLKRLAMHRKTIGDKKGDIEYHQRRGFNHAKEIDKAADEYQKAHLEERKYFVLKKLCERYNELYGKNLMEEK